MTSRSFIPVALIASALSLPTLAVAQVAAVPASTAGREPGRARSFEIAVGGELLTAQGLGTGTATMTSNNPTGTPFTYFVVEGTRTAAPALRARVGYNLTPMFTVEGGLVAGWANVEGAVSSDAEKVPGLTVTERMGQVFVDVAVLAHFHNMAFAGGAGVPFLEAGGGYLRQSHEGNAVITTGQMVHVGGGLTYMFSRRTSSRLTGLGVRIDGRLYVPRKSYAFGNSYQVFGGLGGSFVIAF